MEVNVKSVKKNSFCSLRDYARPGNRNFSFSDFTRYHWIQEGWWSIFLPLPKQVGVAGENDPSALQVGGVDAERLYPAAHVYVQIVPSTTIVSGVQSSDESWSVNAGTVHTSSVKEK